MKWFSLVYQGDIHPSTDEKVIHSKDFSQLVQASEIVEKAHEDAALLLENTKKECENLRKLAKEEGLQEGLEKFNEQILLLDQQIKKMRHDLQQMVLPIALKAAKKIVGKELELFPETILDIVLSAITPISESRQVIIYVNKKDKGILEKNRPKLTEILAQVEVLTIQEKEGITEGGCVIQTPDGMINATIENQYKAIERAFEKYGKTTLNP